MRVLTLDHVNIRTRRLNEMSRFYASVLGLKKGPRPPLAVGGAWHYVDDHAAVHLVDVAADAARAPVELGIEHFAITASGIDAFVARLRRRDVPYWLRIVPAREICQVNVRDPDGNHVEVAFLGERPKNMSDFPGRSALAKAKELAKAKPLPRRQDIKPRSRSPRKAR